MISFHLAKALDAQGNLANAVGRLSRIEDEILIFAFEEKEVRDSCLDQEKATRLYGHETAQGLQHRLADIEAADRIADLIAGRPAAINGTELYKLDISDTHRLVFCHNHGKRPTTQNGQVDWPNVRRIKITSIEGYDA